MLKIRLKRVGKKAKPFYKIVVIENLSKRNGKSIADVGFYNPLTNLAFFNNNILYQFINSGAVPTNTVRHLILKLLNENKLQKVSTLIN
jgi:small subunit ribosomal protein S16